MGILCGGQCRAGDLAEEGRKRAAIQHNTTPTTQLFPFFFHVFVSVFVFLFVIVWYGGRDRVVRNAGEWTSLGCGLSPEDELEVPTLTLLHLRTPGLF